MTFTVPDDAPAGFGTVSLSLSTPGTSDLLSNDVPFGVSPTITSPRPATVAASVSAAALDRDLQPHRTSGPECRPAHRGQPSDGAAGHGRHHEPDLHGRSDAGRDYPLRLRIDGADSRLIADRTATPPVFDPEQTVTVT